MTSKPLDPRFFDELGGNFLKERPLRDIRNIDELIDGRYYLINNNGRQGVARADGRTERDVLLRRDVPLGPTNDVETGEDLGDVIPLVDPNDELFDSDLDEDVPLDFERDPVYPDGDESGLGEINYRLNDLYNGRRNDPRRIAETIRNRFVR